ncbi:MAG: AbrB/MazE/SpoVT family DNA-binding domain-containing protein [Chloroflexi bacterium]|nr:AbrB/MazE/SpoVT family DNA-binding domain-containing protein [Chloroflexota bacterium]
MKATGIVRRVDELGRIVIPKEIRRTFGIDIKDPLEIYVEGENIVLTKYHSTCVFCGHSNGVQSYRGKFVCSSCLSELLK